MGLVSRVRTKSRATRTNPACCPGPRITSGVTMCQTRAPSPHAPSYPRRRVSRATRTNPACCPGPRITSGVTMCQTNAPSPHIPVIPAQAGIQGHPHQSRLLPWTPDHVRGDDVSDKCTLTPHPRHTRAGGYPGPPAPIPPAALDPGSRSGVTMCQTNAPSPHIPVIPAQAGIQGATRTNPACCPGPRITSGVTMCQTRAP
jgi:hypothetical protein